MSINWLVLITIKQILPPNAENRKVSGTKNANSLHRRKRRRYNGYVYNNKDVTIMEPDKKPTEAPTNETPLATPPTDSSTPQPSTPTGMQPAGSGGSSKKMMGIILGVLVLLALLLFLWWWMSKDETTPASSSSDTSTSTSTESSESSTAAGEEETSTTPSTSTSTTTLADLSGLVQTGQTKAEVQAQDGSLEATCVTATVTGETQEVCTYQDGTSVLKVTYQDDEVVDVDRTGL
jgi:hypothetical protein